MEKYEIACIFRAEDENFSQGKTEFLEKIRSLGLEVQEEEDLGIRVMKFPIKKNYQGHYFVFQVLAAKNIISSVKDELKLQENLLRTLTLKI